MAMAPVQRSAKAGTATPLAPIPTSTPELPAVFGRRKRVLDALLDVLLSPGTCDFSLHNTDGGGDGAQDGGGDMQRRRTVSASGMGGSGKTTMAAAVVHDRRVRTHFDKVAFVTMGQTPELMVHQREVYIQLTGDRLPSSTTSTVASQATALTLAANGNRWLVVIDDLWDPAHEIRFITEESAESRVLVTTRFSDILGGATEVPLGLLAADEATMLLFDTAGVERTEPRIAVVAELARLGGYLPLFVGMIGRQIAEYGEDNAWETEVLEMLKEDRSSVFDARQGRRGGTVSGSAGGGGNGANGIGDDGHDFACGAAGGFGVRIVGKNLATIKEDVPHKLFAAMAVCPEDVPVPSEVLEMVWCSKARTTRPLPSIAKMQIRMAVLALLNRNLLLGAPGAGIKMHDVVRDFCRGGQLSSDLLEQQRVMVQQLLAASPAHGYDEAGGGDDGSSPLTCYVMSALRQHMVEAIDHDATPDSNALRWLYYAPDRYLTDFAVQQAASVVGKETLIKLGAAKERQHRFWDAGRDYLFAARAAKYEVMTSGKSLGLVAQSGTELYCKAASCFQRIEGATDAQRSLELVARGAATVFIDWKDPRWASSTSRIIEIIEQGYGTPTDPLTMVQVGNTLSTTGGMVQGWGPTEPGCASCHLDLAKQQAAAKLLWEGAKLCVKTALTFPAEDERRHMVLYSSCVGMCLGFAPCWHFAEQLDMAEIWTLEFTQYWASHYRFDAHHDRVQTYPGGIHFDTFLHPTPAPGFAVARHGDVRTATVVLEKYLQLLPTRDVIADSTMHLVCVHGIFHTAKSVANGFLRWAGLGPKLIACQKLSRMTYLEAEATLRATRATTFDPWQWEDAEASKASHGVTFLSWDWIVDLSKLAHYLMAPEDIDDDEFLAWLPAPGCTGGQRPDMVEVLASAPCGYKNDVQADVFEQLGRYTEAIETARIQRERSPYSPLIQFDSMLLTGRCLAAAGDEEAAGPVFDQGIAEAHRIRAYFGEMMGVRDKWLSCGRQEPVPLTALGRAIHPMGARQLDTYSQLLGAGVDAAAALAAYTLSHKVLDRKR